MGAVNRLGITESHETSLQARAVFASDLVRVGLISTATSATGSSD